MQNVQVLWIVNRAVLSSPYNSVGTESSILDDAVNCIDCILSLTFIERGSLSNKTAAIATLLQLATDMAYAFRWILTQVLVIPASKFASGLYGSIKVGCCCELSLKLCSEL